MKKYTVAINKGGRVIFPLHVIAKNFKDAAEEWAKILGFNDCLFNKEKSTYYGWKIVQTKQEPLQRKQRLGFFSY